MQGGRLLPEGRKRIPLFGPQRGASYLLIFRDFVYAN
jgi:hypothetical protein